MYDGKVFPFVGHSREYILYTPIKSMYCGVFQQYCIVIINEWIIIIMHIYNSEYKDKRFFLSELLISSMG